MSVLNTQLSQYRIERRRAQMIKYLLRTCLPKSFDGACFPKVYRSKVFSPIEGMSSAAGWIESTLIGFTVVPKEMPTLYKLI